MDIRVYFPIVDPLATTTGELRQIGARFAPDRQGNPEITLTPDTSSDEHTQIKQALASIDAWCRAAPERQCGDDRRGVLTLGLQSKRASTDSSLQLAIAAADWAARRSATSGQPRALLVATGALPDAQTVTAEASLRVLAVEGIELKAALILNALEPGGTLEKMTKPDSRSGYAGCKVMFAYAAGSAIGPKAQQALDKLHQAGVMLVPVSEFADLIAAWYPPPPITCRRKRMPTLAVTLVVGILGSVSAVMGGMWVVAPASLEAAAAHLVVPAQLRALADDSARLPDDAGRGCTALASASGSTAVRQTYGWRVVNDRIAACQALLNCDLMAASPMERPAGRLLRQMAEDPAELAQARQACAAAEAAFPTVGRLPYQLSRALQAGDDRTQSGAWREALQRAVALGDTAAMVENLRRQASDDPVLVRTQFTLLTRRNDAHPDALRSFAELLACGLLPSAGSARGLPPALADLGMAADLFDRATTSRQAENLSNDQRNEMREMGQSVRSIVRTGLPGLPKWCPTVTRVFASP